MDCSTPGLPVPHYLPEFAQVHVHWIGDAIQPSHPLPFTTPEDLPSRGLNPTCVSYISCLGRRVLYHWCHLGSLHLSSLKYFLFGGNLLQTSSSIRVFSSESALRIRWPKYWSFSFSIHPSSKYSGLISFRMEWFDLLAVQGTLKSLLQHDSAKASEFKSINSSAIPMYMYTHTYIQYVSKFGKCKSGHRTGKSQFSFQPQRKAMPENVQTTTQLSLFHMPER